MKKLLSCKFNIDTARVELKYSDGSMLAIDCDGIEDEYAKTICQRSTTWSTTPRWNARSRCCVGMWRSI